ncbi:MULTISPECIES: ElyC/SanA/YdcF family protein [Proteus]|uniref:ElyC/SanA/YdcF family protein n=1 Tax=Proteus TaxID=583 RepID=UPI000D6E3F62|nr:MULTISPECIES: ElyC/SanA/YdcF family protein [Proteus]MBG2838187.1 YdcF family protein [Proteus terrae subsp. cibarius]MBG2868168.1 YdcF family protein [Proteus terrae subsp. cibarius]MBJ2109908.1 YdcF family protein [Proteus terrae]MBJ2134691.1 YdcF family protein [Proteus terrae]MCO7050133.1 YdcF family protein [Proteus terrae]
MAQPSRVSLHIKKTVISLAIAALGFTVSSNALAYQKVHQPDNSYQQYVSQRQTVDSLIQDALDAFKSPARVSDAGFTGKLPSNMEIVAQKLQQAYKLEPYRLDLLFSTASAYIYNNDVPRAITIYKQILEAAPDDIDALIYVTSWTRFEGQDKESEAYFAKLKSLNPAKADELKRFFAEIDRVSKMPLSDKLTQTDLAKLNKTKDNNAIVTLGYALNPDGTMNKILIERLNKTLEVAKQLPEAMIVVTGGVPKAHQTEGKLMADWLVKNGIAPERIFQENYARTTVENALFSRYALTKHRIKTAVIISSGSHVRRADAIFTLASWQSGPSDITYLTVVAPDKPLAELQKASKSDIQGIYRDGLKALGLWSFRSYPLEER